MIPNAQFLAEANLPMAGPLNSYEKPRDNSIVAPDSSIGKKADSSLDLVLEATETLHRLSKHREAAPTDVHKRVLQLIQGSYPGAMAASTGNKWSDGSMWVRVLDMGSAQQKRVTVLNMLEYMGAWEWYDGQIKLAQNTVFTKKGKLVDRRGAATHVLDGIEKFEESIEERPRWISGVGRVTAHKEGIDLFKNSQPSVDQAQKHLRRKQITLQLIRGRKLTTKLVKELGTGILFHRKIW